MTLSQKVINFVCEMELRTSSQPRETDFLQNIEDLSGTLKEALITKTADFLPPYSKIYVSNLTYQLEARECFNPGAFTEPIIGQSIILLEQDLHQLEAKSSNKVLEAQIGATQLKIYSENGEQNELRVRIMDMDQQYQRLQEELNHLMSM